MQTIKGPITFGKKGTTAAELVKSGAVKLPFSATGWKSTMNSDLVSGEVDEAVAYVEKPDVKVKSKKEVKKKK